MVQNSHRTRAADVVVATLFNNSTLGACWAHAVTPASIHHAACAVRMVKVYMDLAVASGQLTYNLPHTLVSIKDLTVT
jgi:hypothetical protein